MPRRSTSATVTSRARTVRGKFKIPTFQEVIDLAKRESRKRHRTIGIYPEAKHPTFHNAIGLPLEGRLVNALKRNGLNTRTAPVFIQSVEQSNLKQLNQNMPMSRTFGFLATDEGLDEVKTYADGIGPWKVYKYLAFYRLGVDGVFSDFPDTAFAAREIFRGL